MSAISESCKGSIVLADYVNIDSSGKANIIGAGVSFLGFDHITNATAPFGLYVRLVTLLPLTHDTQAAMEIVLTDADGHPVSLPGPAGPQAMRIAQNIEFTRASLPGTEKPPVEFPSAHSAAVQFSSGLTLQPGVQYAWVVKLDHEEITKTHFMIPVPAPEPVIG